MSNLKNKRELCLFEKSLKEWAIEFEKTHDGSIATSSEFVGYVKNYRTVETIVSYVLSPDTDGPDEEAFLKQTQIDIVQGLEERLSHQLPPLDAEVILNFLKSLLNQTKRFASSGLRTQEKFMLYVLCQNRAKNREMEKIFRKHSGMTEQMLSQILEAISAAQVATQLPPEFDQLILNCNDTLRKSQESLKVYAFSDSLDFRSVYIPPSLNENVRPDIFSQMDIVSNRISDLDIMEFEMENEDALAVPNA